MTQKTKATFLCIVVLVGLLTASGLLRGQGPLECSWTCYKEYNECVNAAWTDYYNCTGNSFREELQCWARLEADLIVCGIVLIDCLAGCWFF